MGRAAPRVLALLALTMVTVVLGSALGAAPVFAHGQLAVSTPADGSTLSAPVDSVSLAFTEMPATFAYFTVTAPSGIRVDQRWSHAEPVRLVEPVREYQLVNDVWEPRLFHIGYPARIPIAYFPEQGVYVVRYQTVASDGEEVNGEVRFTYTGALTPAPAGWQAPTDQPSPELLAAAGHARPTEVADPSPAVAPRAAPAAGRDGLSVWLVPVLLLIGTTVMIARVARRPCVPVTAPTRPTRPAGGRPNPAPKRRKRR